MEGPIVSGRERGRERRMSKFKEKGKCSPSVSGRNIRGNSEWKEGGKRKGMRMTRCGLLEEVKY